MKKNGIGESFMLFPKKLAYVFLKPSFLLILLFFSLLFSTSAIAQNAKVNLSIKGETLKQVMIQIEEQTDYVFFYSDDDVNINQIIKVNLKGASLESALGQILKTNSFKIDDQSKKIYILSRKKKESVQLQIQGNVQDEYGDPVIGARVTLKGANNVGTITDIDGNFSLEMPSNSTIVVSFIGYKSKEYIVKSDKPLNLILEEDRITMDEVVVVGYGTMRKSDLTGAMSTLNSEDFNVGVMTSPTEMMQGRVAGINITSTSGEPGAGLTVRVRGSNSIRSGQDPLYVIDGVPLDISDDQAGGGSIAGVGSAPKKNPLNFLNPDDIQSMEVLKDASATAIYGARGGNGVILITTKKGKVGKPSVSYSGYASVSSLPKKLPILSASDFRNYVNENGLNVTDMGANTNWQDEIYRTAMSQNHNLSLSGGTEKTLYRFSLSYMDQNGIIDRTGLKKYTGRFNLSQEAFDGKVKFEANTTIARTDDQRVPIGETGGHEGDVILSSLKLNPTFPVYGEDGKFFQSSSDERNPVAMIQLTNDKNRTDRVLSNLTTTFKIIEGLNYKINLAIDHSKTERKVTQHKDLIYLTDGGTVDINNLSFTSKLMENFITYDFKIGNAHRFNLLGGHSYQHFKMYSHGFSEKGFKNDEVDYLNNLQMGDFTNAEVRSNITVNELQSFYTRINYNLLDKYALTATVRADGSTKFGKNNKYGFFPSVSFAWRLGEEKFIQDLNLFSNLKVRTGWGITGNQEIPNKISQASLGTTSKTGAILDGSSTNVTPGITLTRTPNPDLKWESTYQYNLGIDFGFLDNRLTGSIDLFHKKTKDVLLQVYSMAPAPTTQVWSNVPSIRIINKGFELELNGVIIDNKDWTWNMGTNFSLIKNQVKDLPMSQITTGSPSGPGINGYKSQVIMSNKPIGTFWGYKFLGFDEEGKNRFETDENGKPIEQDLGSALPKFTLNLNTSLRYKNWDLSLFFNGVFGNKIYNNLANIMDQKTLLPKGWNAIGGATRSKESFDNTLVYSDRFIEDGSFVRLSSASLGYTFNTSKFKYVNKLHLYVAANNLFVITNYSGYDPEVNSNHASNSVPSMGIDWTSYPKSRTFSFGVNVEF
ncbi:TonB-dependent receptor [Bacteroides coprosuis]|uniref:TonB-dependent receptor n=1 Tax=Bacteroides coprosuis TaxID=151276 RepID=UPI001D4F0AE9|nr:TonB-dependent receptor [Bacteroides coprosuis]HJD92920.1 TonB-dependent receptor [Bacteroides coprosuis]